MARNEVAAAPNNAAHKDPRWLAAYRQLHEMRRKRGELEVTIRGECERRERIRHGEGRMAAARAILEGREPEAACEDKEVSKLRHEVLILVDAEELAEKQLLEVETRVSAEIIARVKPAYVDLQKRVHAAAEVLVELAEEERRFRADLEDGGTRFGGLTPICWPRATEETLERYRREALEYYGLKL